MNFANYSSVVYYLNQYDFYVLDIQERKLKSVTANFVVILPTTATRLRANFRSYGK